MQVVYRAVMDLEIRNPVGSQLARTKSSGAWRTAEQ
jgi:hypothetical protein